MNRAALITVICLSVTAALGQSSFSYRLEEAVFNSGGHPSQGAVLSSTGYQIRLDSLGEAIAGPAMTAASYQVQSGFGPAYLPPSEVRGLRFESADTLAWNPDPAAGTYNLYRDLLNTVSGYGACHQQSITGSSANDAGPVPYGEGYFYLVTVENRIGEEGGKGQDSTGAMRGGGTCP